MQQTESVNCIDLDNEAVTVNSLYFHTFLNVARYKIHVAVSVTTF